MCCFFTSLLAIAADVDKKFLEVFNNPPGCFKLCRKLESNPESCYQKCITAARNIMGCPREKEIAKNEELIPYAGQFVGFDIEIPNGATDCSKFTSNSTVVVGIQQFPDPMIDDKLHVSVLGPPVTGKEYWEQKNFLDWMYLDFYPDEKRQLYVLNCHELKTILDMINDGKATFHGQLYWHVGNKEFKNYFASHCNDRGIAIMHFE